MDRKDVDIMILSDLSYHYNAEVRMREISSGWLTREWIEKAILNQYAFIPNIRGLESGDAYGTNQWRQFKTPDCPLTGHKAKGCGEYIVIRREHKPNR